MAQQADGTIYINTAIQTDGFKAGSKDLENAVRRTASKISGIGKSAETAMQKQVNTFAKANAAYAQQEKKVRSLENELKKMSSQKVMSPEYANLDKELNRLGAEYDKLAERQSRFLATGGKQKSNTYQRMEYDLDRLDEKQDQVIAKMRQMEASGTAYTKPDTSGLEQRLAVEQEKLRQINNSLGVSYESLKSKVDSYSSSAINLASVKKRLVNSFSSLLSTARKTAKTIGGTLVSALKRAGAAMLNLHKNTKKSDRSIGTSLKTMLKYGLGIRSVFVLMNRLRSALVDGFKNLAQYDGRTNASISSLMSSLTQLKNSFATAFAPILNVVAPILRSFIDMISRAVTYVGMFIASLTGQSSFVKATAVQEDYAASLGDSADAAKEAEKAQNSYLSGLDEIRRFEEPDTGKSDTGNEYTAPTPQDMFETVPIESSIKGLADKIKSFISSQDWKGLGTYIADGLNRGLKKIKKVISWSNVGPAITSFANGFTTTFNSLVSGIDWNLMGQTVGTGINTIVNTVNQFITGIDWVNLGASFANGINGIVNSVDWNNLGNILGNYFMISWQIFYGLVTTIDWSQVGTAIANGLNGFFETFDFATIASGIAAFVNGLFTAIVNLALTTDWGYIGTAIFNAINTFFEETDFALMGQGISEFIKGLLDVAIKAVEGTDWKKIGSKLAELIVNIDWGGITSRLFEAFGALLGGLASFLWGLIKKGWDSVVKWWKDVAYEDGKFTITGLLNGIWEGIKSIGSWIYNHIFKPFIDGFKKAFGINSPSTVMADQGGYIISGLLNGLKNKFISVVKWLGELPAKFKEFFQKAKDKVVEVFGNIGSWFSEKFSGAWTSIKNAFSLSNAKNFFKDVWNGITSSFGNIAGWFRDKFSAAWQAVKDVFSSGGRVFDGIKDGILNGLKAVINGLIRGINDVIAVPFDGINWALRNIRDIEILGFRPFDWIGEIGVPQIPYLATGAVIPPNAPFMAVLGDQRNGNNLEMPENLLRKIIREETGRQGTGNNTYTFIGQINRRTLFEEMMDEAQLVRGRTGRNPFEMA